MNRQVAEQIQFPMRLMGLPRLVAIRWLWVPLLMFTLTRFGIVLVAYLTAPLIADSAVEAYHLKPANILLDVFGSRWDTGFYLDIAEAGYKYQGEQLPSVAFFPLFPVLIRAVSSLLGDPLIAGVVVANVALLGATVLFYHLVVTEWGESVAGRAIWYFLIFPTSFFGSAVYSESLFLLMAIGALYFARKGYWESAAMLGFAAALTRFVGLIVAPMLLAEWWMQRQRQPAETRPPMLALLAPVFVPLGTITYMILLYRNFGDPLAFVKAAAVWGRTPKSPLALMSELTQTPAEGWAAALLAGHLPLNNWFDLLAVVLFITLGAVLLQQRRWSEGLFVLLGVLIPFSSGLLMSQCRYVWVLFPAFILLARWGERPWVDRVVTTLSLLGLGVFTAMFANWYWVG